MKQAHSSPALMHLQVLTVTFCITVAYMLFVIPRAASGLSVQTLLPIANRTASSAGAANVLTFPLFPAKTQPEAGTPVRIVIPTIHVDAPVESVGLTADGSMDVPTKWENTGWYNGGPRPGDTGNAVIDGHLDSDTGTAVFWNLQKLVPGDTIQVVDDQKRTWTFRIRQVQVYKENDAPLDVIFGPSDGAHLNLITCGGTWNKKLQRYDERLAVFADSVTTDTASGSTYSRGG